MKAIRTAARRKNDEFYTLYKDIEEELSHYSKDNFSGKTIYLNCDNPHTSNFVKYFTKNMITLEIKKLMITFFDEEVASLTTIVNNNGLLVEEVTPLSGNGDFRSEECVEFLKEADLVVTNPPFSIFKDFINLMMEHNKDFLVLGNYNQSCNKVLAKYFLSGKVTFGVGGCGHSYVIPERYRSEYENKPGFTDYGTHMEVKLGMTTWFTTLPHNKVIPEVEFKKEYYGNEDQYPTYDDYPAIHVSRATNIPGDYYLDMAVPITFLDKLNTNQFEFKGYLHSYDVDHNVYLGKTNIGDGQTYARIVIRRKSGNLTP